MALTDSTIASVRYWLYVAALGVNLLDFILLAVALGALQNIVADPNKGAAGWSIFLSIVYLVLLPATVFARTLSGWGLGFLHYLNRTGIELIISASSVGLWFITGIVLAVYADSANCDISGPCDKYRAATAFAWFEFLILVVNLVLLVIFASRQKKAGLPLMVSYTVDHDGRQTSYPAQSSHAEAGGVDTVKDFA